MTRRVVVFKRRDAYMVSQEFNGDKSEAEIFKGETGIRIDWQDAVSLFDGVDTMEKFCDTVRELERLYGYKPEPIRITDKMPETQEVWVMSHGNLLLDSMYGKPLVYWLADVAERYGFKGRYINKESIDIRAKNTDGEWCTWFSIVPDYDGVRGVSGWNTDQLNIWLHETRPDMTPERCIMFFEELSRALGLFGEDKLKVSEWIDPEDWQEIAGVQDAYEDKRYTGKEKG